MSYTAWESIAETPWWIFFIIFVLLLTAYSATKPRYIQLKPELAMQSFCMGLLCLIVTYYVPFTLYNLGLLLAGLISGYIIGWTHFRIRKIQAVKGNYTMYVPGSWAPMFVIPCLIIAKFWFFGSQYKIDLEALSMPLYQHYFAVFAGTSFGLFFGRATILLRRLRLGPYLETPLEI